MKKLLLLLLTSAPLFAWAQEAKSDSTQNTSIERFDSQDRFEEIHVHRKKFVVTKVVRIVRPALIAFEQNVCTGFHQTFRLVRDQKTIRRIAKNHFYKAHKWKHNAKRLKSKYLRYAKYYRR